MPQDPSQSTSPTTPPAAAVPTQGQGQSAPQDVQGILQQLYKLYQQQGGGAVPQGQAPPSGGGQPQSSGGQASPMPQPSAPIQTAPPTQGGFGATRGILGIISKVEQSQHEKKAAMAENYMSQINGLLTSGDPNDRKKAEMFLEDPKILKILKTGLEYQPLTEPPPPEAIGVHTALAKIRQKPGLKNLGGSIPQKQPQQQAPPGKPILPQPNQSAALESTLKLAGQLATVNKTAQETNTSASQGKLDEARAGLAGSQSLEAQAKAAQAKSDASKADAEAAKAKAEAENEPQQKAKLQAEAQELKARAAKDYADANKANTEAKRGGSVSEVRLQFKTAYDGIKDIQNKAIQDMTRLQNSRSGIRKALGSDAPGLPDAQAKVKKITKAVQWFNTQQSDITSGKMTIGDATKKAYDMAGLSPSGDDKKDFGPAPEGKQDGDTGTMPDGTKVVVSNGRLVNQ